MRETISRAELLRRFHEALSEHPQGRGGTFVFEIDAKDPGPGECNWYPLASLQLWTGDLRANLAAFREVREQLSARYNLHVPAPHPEGAGEPSEALAK